MERNIEEGRRGVSGRTLIALLALVLAVGCAVGGTVAWLTATSATVVNTFTYGDIDISLTETTTSFKIIPGVDIAKDPKVTVTKDSEACWLFVKVEEANWPAFTEGEGASLKVKYEIAAGWIPGTGTGTGGNGVPVGVFYREVGASATADQDFYVLAGNTTNPNGVVTVSENLTKAEIPTTTTDLPKLTFTAYAVQKVGIATAADAWLKVSA